MNSGSRRNFLKNAGLLASGVGLESLAGGTLSGLILAARRALAAEQADASARFVLIRVHGAMDSTLGLHPYLSSNASGFAKEDLYLGYEGAHQPLANVLGTEISLGPAAAQIAPFAKNMAIVRGIIVGPNDFGHPFAIQHMTSGRTQETAPGWTSYIGSDFAKNDDSYVVTNAPLYRGTLKQFPMHLTAILRTQIEAIQKARSASPLSVYSGNEALGASHYLKLLSSGDKLGKFLSVLNSQQGDVSDEVIVAAALHSGLARVGQIDIQVDEGGNLDTHQGHQTSDGPQGPSGHLPAQKNRWDRIAKFLELLKSLALFDNTTVVVITEFNRSPGINGAGGKDHNYTDNAAVIFGRGVNGGAVVGDRTLYTRADGFPYAYWAGSHINFETGNTAHVKKVKAGQKIRAPKESSLIHPADLWASVITSLDPALIGSLPAGARVIPKLFRS